MISIGFQWADGKRKSNMATEYQTVTLTVHLNYHCQGEDFEDYTSKGLVFPFG